MTEWVPQVVKIEKVEMHPNADALDICTVLGDYPVITKRNEYKINDLAGYIPIDSIVPDTEMFYFLCPKAYEKYEDENGQIQNRQLGPKYLLGQVPEKYRIIKAKKIRDIYSMGMLISASDLELGQSIIDLIGLKKWEQEEEDNLPSVKTKGKNAEKPPVGWSIPYYDLESVRKYFPCIENEQDVILTEKIHGSNAGYCYDGTKLVVKSRNFYKKFDPEDMWADAAIRYKLEEKLSKYPMMVFFAECAGQVKGFRYDAQVENGRLLTKLFFFDIWDVKAQRFLDYDYFSSIIDELELEATPLIYRGPCLSKEEMYALAERKTAIGGKHIAEGWVLSLGKERYEPRLNSRLKLKYVSQQYTLQK